MEKQGKLQNAVALVTGAGQGVGRATAIRLTEEGACVAINGRIPHPTIDEVAEITGGLPVIADIADPDQVAQMARIVEEKLGPIEILVANAARMTMKPFLEQDPDEWWDQIRINLGGHINCIHAVLPGMRRIGRGRIIIVGSKVGVIGWENTTGYSASKSGLHSLGVSLARELGPEGIVVNIVAPGTIDTPQQAVDAADANLSLEEYYAIRAQRIPARRIGRSEEIAATIAFLAGEGGPAFAGKILQPNGGEVRCSS
jgi:NAD(P)-dependent dehydrogenase (short-subunit alcohol dehydrogenase family)